MTTLETDPALCLKRGDIILSYGERLVIRDGPFPSGFKNSVIYWVRADGKDFYIYGKWLLFVSKSALQRKREKFEIL
jgi:hypothetical protein